MKIIKQEKNEPDASLGITALACCAAFYGAIFFKPPLVLWVAGGIVGAGISFAGLLSSGPKSKIYSGISLFLFLLVLLPLLLLLLLGLSLNGHGITPFM